ncbi:hydrolase-oxidase [Escherichia coli]|nr:hydrolase-oxidase [Escherichia coli]
MKNTELEQLINEKLNSAAISDYAPNGLQVEGKETVQKLLPVSLPARLCSMRQCVWARMRSLCIMATSGKANLRSFAE